MARPSSYEFPEHNRRAAHILVPSMHRFLANKVALAFPGNPTRYWKIAETRPAIIVPGGALVAEQDKTGNVYHQPLILRSHNLAIISGGHVAVQSRLAGWIEPPVPEDAPTEPSPMYIPESHLVTENEALAVTRQTMQLGQAILCRSQVYAALTELCWTPLPHDNATRF